MKFENKDKAYLQNRKTLEGELGIELWNIVDHWPLYCGIANLARNVAIIDLVRSTLDVPGHIAEFGCWRGANLMLLAKLMEIFDPHSLKEIHGFDSFQGLTTFATEDKDAAEEEGRYKGDLKGLQALIDLYELQDTIQIHKGLIGNTLPEFLERRPEATFSLVYCDTDLYEPTRDILTMLHERLSKGGIFVFDEWNIEKWPGETVAAREFIATHSDHYVQEHVRGTRQPNFVLRKM